MSCDIRHRNEFTNMILIFVNYENADNWSRYFCNHGNEIANCNIIYILLSTINDLILNLRR